MVYVVVVSMYCGNMCVCMCVCVLWGYIGGEKTGKLKEQEEEWKIGRKREACT